MALTTVPLWAWKVGGVVGVLAVGYGWLKEHDARVRAEGKAEALAESVDSLRAVAESALTQVAVTDSVVAVQKVVIESQQQEMAEVARVARRQTQVAVATLRETLDSAQKVMLDQIEASFDRQLAAKDSMFAAQARLTALAEQQVSERDVALAKLQQASSVVYDAWEEEKKRARPSLAKKIVRAVPVVLSTVGLTLLITD